jgi:hypothetical protein
VISDVGSVQSVSLVRQVVQQLGPTIAKEGERINRHLSALNNP